VVAQEVLGDLTPTEALAEEGVSNSKFGRHRAIPGGCGARDRRAGHLTPSGAPYPPYSEPVL